MFCLITCNFIALISLFEEIFITDKFVTFIVLDSLHAGLNIDLMNSRLYYNCKSWYSWFFNSLMAMSFWDTFMLFKSTCSAHAWLNTKVNLKYLLIKIKAKSLKIESLFGHRPPKLHMNVNRFLSATACHTNKTNNKTKTKII